MTQNNPHNEMPKDTVEEAYKEFTKMKGESHENIWNLCVLPSLTTAYNKGVEVGELSDDEIDARVATFEIATDEQRKFIEMGMLDYRQAIMDKEVSL